MEDGNLRGDTPRVSSGIRILIGRVTPRLQMKLRSGLLQKAEFLVNRSRIEGSANSMEFGMFGRTKASPASVFPGHERGCSCQVLLI